MAALTFDEECKALRAANERRLQELGLISAVAQFKEAAAKDIAAGGPSRPRKQPSSKRPAAAADAQPREVRRSTRERAQVTYNEDAAFRQLLPHASSRGAGGGSGRGRQEQLTLEEVEALRALHGASRMSGAAAGNGDDEDTEGGGKRKGPRGPRDSGKGVRKQGGQWYDSEAGVTCHWCRQKTVSRKVTCTNTNCGGGRRMPTSFCGRCLMNRHGEDVEQAEASRAWVCPPCRGTCGRGCVVCCNCGPCRKRAELGPTHQIMTFARAKGYDNAHDYLVGQITGETQEQLTQRKLEKPWGVWMKEQQQPGREGGAAGGGEEDEEVDEQDEEDEQDGAEVAEGEEQPSEEIEEEEEAEAGTEGQDQEEQQEDGVEEEEEEEEGTAAQQQQAALEAAKLQGVSVGRKRGRPAAKADKLAAAAAAAAAQCVKGKNNAKARAQQRTKAAGCGGRQGGKSGGSKRGRRTEEEEEVLAGDDGAEAADFAGSVAALVDGLVQQQQLRVRSARG